MEDFERIAVTIRDAVRDIPKQFNENREEISKLEKERSDLLHMAELVNLNARDGYKLYKEIQAVEKKRRNLKDENEFLKHLKPIVNQWKSKVFDLDEAIGSIRNTKNTMENRNYRCRIRKDLQKKINGRRDIQN